MLDAITVRNGQTDYLVTDSTFNANEQMTQYINTVHEDGQDTFTETNDMTYDAEGRISQLAYDSTSRTIDYGYDTTTGKLESIDFSDLGEYSINYSTVTGNISSVVYPNSGGTETFVYNGDLGRLSQIAYPNDKDLNLTWNGKNQITQISYDDNGSVTTFALSYNGGGKLASYTKSEGGIQTEVWDFHYGPFGLEKADRTSSPTITEDFTLDPNGRILSMTYTQSGAGEGVNGEYYFHYDNFGNTTLLTDSFRNRKYAALYDLNNGKIIEEWNPNSLVLVNKGEGIYGGITFVLPDTNETSLVFADYEMKINTFYKPIPIDWGTVTTVPPFWGKGGVTFKPCVTRCPAGQHWSCTCIWACAPNHSGRYTGYRVQHTFDKDCSDPSDDTMTCDLKSKSCSCVADFL